VLELASNLDPSIPPPDWLTFNPFLSLGTEGNPLSQSVFHTELQGLHQLSIHSRQSSYDWATHLSLFKLLKSHLPKIQTIFSGAKEAN
jgi:hypothetical protein